MNGERDGLLRDVRIADFSWIGAGSYATKLLADLGADVIKIESSVYPDLLRTSRPFKDGLPGVNRSGYFADRNASKRSITLNMKSGRGRELARALIAKSDVVCNNFAPGVMERWGVGYETVRALKPDIVFISMSMQGATGPEKDYIGYGMTMTALAGLQHLTGLPDRPPAGTGTNYPDHVPNPCHAAFAIVAALLHRRRTGEGQYVDLAQTEPTVALLGPVILDCAVNGRNASREGNAHPAFAPHGVYPCAGSDRWLALCVETDEQWKATVEVLGAPADLADPRWRARQARWKARDELDRLIALHTGKRDGEELMLRFQAKGVAAGTVRDAADMLRDEQLHHRGHWRRLDHLEMGVTTYNRQPFQLSKSSVGPHRSAPLLGEHTEEICTSILGLSASDVSELREAGVLV